MRKRVAAATVIVVVAALAAGAVWWWGTQQQTELEQAVTFAPAASERLTWTDWRGVRAELGADLHDASTMDQLNDFLARGYEADLTSTSALLGSAEALHEQFGFSPATLDWELLSQSSDGAVVIMRLPEDADFDGFRRRLADLGYADPEDDTGVWRGGPTVVARIQPSVTPELQHIALDEDERLVLASDNSEHLRRVVESSGDEDLPEPLTDVVASSADALSAVFYTGEHVCGALAMGSADADDQAQADELVRAAGEVNPMTGFAMSEQPDGGVRVVMAFETEEQARANADSRAVLAAGPAPGQGGNFPDRFDLGQVSADGELVTMALDPHDGQYVLSDLTTGPVLFATC